MNYYHAINLFAEYELDSTDAFSTGISPEAALSVLKTPVEEMPSLMAAASAVRRHYFGCRVSLCSILNARSGACGEDCGFCAQASCHRTASPVFALRSQEEISSAYAIASKLPIKHFGVVTSGGRLPGGELNRVRDVIERHRNGSVQWCASLGSLDGEDFKRLNAAGLKRFHHNLETAESFFPEVCTTHDYDVRLNTIRAAKRAGLEVCCGGILGMGESLQQRVELACTLRKEGVDSIPLNFLVPVEGTRLGAVEPMRPWDILRNIVMFRLVNPVAEIKVCAGRVLLRDMQSMIFSAGANGMMIGDMLTIAGRSVGEDLQMLHDLELEYDVK